MEKYSMVAHLRIHTHKKPYECHMKPYHCTMCPKRFSTSSDLTHWGRVTHVCVSKLAIIGSDNGLSPDRRQAIIWTNAGLLLIGPIRTNFSEILIEILTFSFKTIRLKVSSAERWPFCLGLNMLNTHCAVRTYGGEAISVYTMRWEFRSKEPS